VTLTILPLAEIPHLIPELARLHFAQWGHLRPDESLEQRTARLRGSCGRDQVPNVLVAVEEGALRGSAMLLAHDMDTRPELTPWLGGVYVLEPWRRRGIGTQLVAAIEAEAARGGADRWPRYVQWA